MKLGILAAVAALTVASPVLAGDWRLSGSNDEIIKGFDIDSLVVSGNRRTVWEVMVFKASNEFETDYYVSRTEYDCSGSRYRDHALSGYVFGRNSGEVIPADLKWVTVFPDTIADGALRVICGLEASEPLEITTSVDFAVVARSVLNAEEN